MWPFSSPKPTPPGVIIRNVLGEEIDRVDGWNLDGKVLRGKKWNHVDLSGQSLRGCDLSGTDMLGADLRGASLNYCKLVDCEISYADASGCDFSNSDMTGCKLYRTETQRAKFQNVLLSEESDIPKMKVFGTVRING